MTTTARTTTKPTMRGVVEKISLKDPPVRRMNRNDKALLETSEWVNNADLKLEDRVSLPHKKAAFLQGIVVYVGKTHFAPGTWVGVQLTGPSLGKGDCNGNYKGKQYFGNVGPKNGVMAPLDKVSKRYGNRTGDPKIDKAQKQRQQPDARIADLNFIDCLVEERQIAMLKLAEERKKVNRFGRIADKESMHITRLKQIRMEQLLRIRGVEPDRQSVNSAPPTLKYSTPGSKLCKPDVELVDGLEVTQQNYCLSDPLLPDNPITFVSQAFLNMTGYHMNEILGKNCRFLQGPETDPLHVNRIRLAIREGSDVQVCLLNYRKDGTKFYNRLFMTALRDTKGRIKNYLGVQCEVTPAVAARINKEEVQKTKAKLDQVRRAAALEISSKQHGAQDKNSAYYSAHDVGVDYLDDNDDGDEYHQQGDDYNDHGDEHDDDNFEVTSVKILEFTPLHDRRVFATNARKPERSPSNHSRTVQSPSRRSLPAMPSIGSDTRRRNNDHHNIAPQSPMTLPPRHSSGKLKRHSSNRSSPAISARPNTRDLRPSASSRDLRHSAPSMPAYANGGQYISSMSPRVVNEFPPWPTEAMKGQFRAPQPSEFPSSQNRRDAPRQPKRQASTGPHERPSTTPPRTPQRVSSSNSTCRHACWTDSSCSDSDFTPQAASPRESFVLSDMQLCQTKLSYLDCGNEDGGCADGIADGIADDIPDDIPDDTIDDEHCPERDPYEC